MEPNITGPISRVMPEIFRPVRTIGNLCRPTQYGADIAGKRFQLANGKISPIAIARCRQRNHFRADQKCLNAACCRAKIRIMQNKPSKSPFCGSGILYLAIYDRKVTDPRGAKKRADISCCQWGFIIRPHRNPAAPWECCLRCTAIGVRQIIARRHIHQDKWMKHHPKSAGRHVPD